MKKVVVRSNQNIYDVCLQEYGTLEFLNKLIVDNNLTYSGDITQGQELSIDENVLANKDVQDFYELNKLNPVNGYIFKNNIPPFTWDNTEITFDTVIKTWDLIKL